MINRDEKGNIVSCDKLSDVTKEISKINSMIQKASKHPEKVTDEQKAELEKAVGDMKAVLELVTPELQKTGSPVELISFAKEMINMKKIAENLEKFKATPQAEGEKQE